MGACTQAQTQTTQHETQIEQNISTKPDNPQEKYNTLSIYTPSISLPYKQAAASLPYKPRSPKNGLIKLASDSNFALSPNTHQFITLENENKQLKKELKHEQTSYNTKYKKLQATLDNQALNYNKEIELMRKQMVALQTDLQQKIVINETATKININDQDKKENKSEETDMLRMRSTQLLDLSVELEKLRTETNTLKATEKQTKSEYEHKINNLQQTIKSLQIINEPSAKPSFTKKTEEKNKKVLTEKDKEIIKLQKELSENINKCKSLEKELVETKEEHNALFERSKTMTEQLSMDKETIKKELKLLKEKDEGFINKIYKERDQFQNELYKIKKQFKERELTLKVEMEALERKKIKAEDLADLKNKTDVELREIIEKLRFTNRDLNDQVGENIASHTQREQEFDEQILGLANIIKNLKVNTNPSKKPRNALFALAGTSPVPKHKKLTVGPRTSGNKFGAASAALAGKLPFGKTKKKVTINEPSTGKVESDIKGAVGSLFAAKQKESGQGPIIDDTKSILGMLDTMQKYNKMKKIGMPMTSIKNKMKLDGFTASQIAKFAGEPAPMPLNGIDLSKHNLKKYEKMKKIGMPQTSVRNKMKMDGIDKKVIATFFGEKLDDADDGGGKPMEPPCPKPELKKYHKMKKIGMPEVSVKNKMKLDGIDPYWVRDFFGEAQPIIGGGGKRPMKAPCPKPDMGKYVKMKKVGLPTPSVKNKMKKDGIHAYWVRDFFGEPQPMIGGDDEEVMKEPCPKPDFAKYSRMKKVGMPEISVRNKMKMDGIHEYWIRDFYGEAQPKIKKKGGKKKKATRKVKALHWRKMSECDWTNTIWANIDTHIELKTITTETLITPELTKRLEAAFSNIRPKKKKGAKKKKDTNKEITLIDPKRAFNMIVGLRQFEKMNINDIKIRNYLLKLDDTKLTVEMLDNLSKFVPSNEELNELRNFKGDRTKLGRAEKFTDVVTCLVDIKMRIDLWQFKIKFKANVFEVVSRINKIRDTLDTLKSSTQIASFLKICLIIGNFMNEGTNRGGAKGIKLESIDRFSSLKTADNSKTMLMFILEFMYKNHNSAGEFDTFPSALLNVVDSAKKIEAKTIRNGIADMKDALERIGKRIARASRNLQQIKEQFHKSAGNVLVVFNKLKHNVTKLKSGNRKKKGRRLKIVDTPSNSTPALDENAELAKSNALENMYGAAGAEEKKHEEKNRQKKGKKNKNISFVSELMIGIEEEKKEEQYSKYRSKKPRKFVIIDPSYKGQRKVRTRKDHEIDIDEKKFDMDDDDMEDLFTRGETMYDTDIEFSDTDLENVAQSPKKKKNKNKNKNKSTHQKTDTGLRRKKKKLKKVKIRRLKRVRRKQNSMARLESGRVSIKTAKTIEKLRAQKEIDATLIELGIDNNAAKKRQSLARKSLAKPAEDPNKAPKDKFESMMTGFHTMAINKVEALDKEFENLKIFSGNVAVFFGEHDDLEWEELFHLFIGFFEQINKAKKLNNDLAKKVEKQRKKEERERLKKQRLAKKGLKPKSEKKSDEPVNILEEIRMKNAKGTLTPSKAKNDVVGYEKVNDMKKGTRKKKKKKKVKGGMSLLEQIKAKGD